MIHYSNRVFFFLLIYNDFLFSVERNSNLNTEELFREEQFSNKEKKRRWNCREIDFATFFSKVIPSRLARASIVIFYLYNNTNTALKSRLRNWLIKRLIIRAAHHPISPDNRDSTLHLWRSVCTHVNYRTGVLYKIG